MSWWSVAPELIMALAIIFGPGALVGIAAGLRGFAVAALAPGMSVTVVSVSAVAAAIAGVPWSVAPVMGLTVLCMGAARLAHCWRIKAMARRAVGSPPAEHDDADERRTLNAWPGRISVAAAVVMAAATLGFRLTGAFGEPEAFSQTFDNVFHLNAIRYILDTGSGSALTVGAMTGGGFYPTAWHDLVSLTVQLTGLSIPAAVNVMNICIGALVWPLSCIYLARVIAGPTLAATWAGAVLSAAFGAFPLLMVDFGVLYPNFLGISFLPAVLALGLTTLGLGADADARRAPSMIALALTVPGLSLAHPSSSMALLALLAPAALFQWWVSLRRSLHGRRSVAVAARYGAALAAAVVVTFMLWTTIRPPKEAAFWAAVESPLSAVAEVVTSSAIGRPASWAVMVLALVGLVGLIRQRGMQWLLGLYAVAAILFIVAASFPAGRIRDFITGIWYNDPPRLAALLPVAILPVAVLGAVRLWQWFGERNRRGADSWPPLRRRLVVQGSGVAAVALLLLATQQANVDVAQSAAVRNYKLDASAPLVSSDELALLQRLDSHVPADATIVGNPWNGSSLAYAVAHRKVLQLHILGAVPQGAGLIYDHLRDARSDPAVCDAVKSLNVGYVLDFGHHEVNEGDQRQNVFTGLDNLAASGAAELIDSQGAARLFKITACG